MERSSVRSLFNAVGFIFVLRKVPIIFAVTQNIEADAGSNIELNKYLPECAPLYQVLRDVISRRIVSGSPAL